MRWRNFIQLTVPVLVCLGVCLPLLAGRDEKESPNILLILADDIGREVLGCYGGQSYETPNLDRLAAGGMRFQTCYTQRV